ncbi:Uncharacterised protein [Citrobacter braakii]|nr:Uncharacterised protein [Citrobacter braakii]
MSKHNMQKNKTTITCPKAYKPSNAKLFSYILEPLIFAK